ncbi:MAG TPA: cell division protein ZipA C-terminal FtsZ-binding domain-containing protein [Rugosibacter sp.]
MALSDLQIVLIGAGAAAVAAVWAYNLWQERKLRRLTETLFTHPQSDTLINTPIAERSTDQEETYDLRDIVERKEPTSSSFHEDAVDVIEPSKENAPGEFSEQIHDASAGKIAEELPKESIDEWPQASIPEPGALPSDWADTLTQCVLRLKTTEPIPATTLWMLQTRWAEQLDKPLYWMAYDSSAASWLKINETATGRHMHWIVALQLADRRGAVSENTLVHFFDGMEQLANHVGADLPLPDPAPIVDHAAALDTFCANVDIQFKVHIVESAGGVFSGTKLRGVAEAAGMQLEEDGCFHARDSAGEELFTLMNLGSEAFTLENLRSLATHGLSLSLDVPRVGDGLATFTRMLATGQQLARALDGVLVDAQRVPLTDVMTSAIRAKITELQQTMREADIVPGSTRAHRLFS